MRLRTRLILAFLLLAVVPLAGATLYSYHSSLRALQEAAEAESGELAREMETRVATVTADLRRRIDRLSGLPHWALGGETRPEPESIRRLLLAEMGDAARYLERIEFLPVVPTPAAPPARVRPPSGEGGRDLGVQIQLSEDLADEAGAAPAGPEAPLQFEADPQGALVLRRAAPPALETGRPPEPAPAPDPPDAGSEIARAFETLARDLEARQRLREAGIPVPAADEQEMGDRLREDLGLPRLGAERAGAVKAQISSREVLRQVMSRTRRDRGEIPFALDRRGNLYTPDPADRPKLEPLGLPESVRGGGPPADGALRGDWVTVLREDPNTGLYFGIARPVGRSLAQLRATAARNLGIGLGLVGTALLGILPLSGRMTRNLARLTRGAESLARGDLEARVPVRSRDEFGALSAAFNRMAAELGESQRRLVEQERIRRELEIGRQIQRDLLPRAALRLPRLEVQGISVPAREVGGDFFNYFALPEGATAVLVGDVSGKGVGAALLMANIQASLKAMLAGGVDLGRLVGRLDLEVEASTPAEVYCTLFVAVIDASGSEIRYVNAGHNPPFLLAPGGAARRLHAGGRPVGLLPGPGYPQESLPLSEGSVLFLYTDGVVESESPEGEPFGMDRIEALLRASRTAPLEDLLAAVDGAVRAHRAGGEAADDATLLAVRLDAARHAPA
jgi:serine phosphatase RsbU (regulator of sigma subunit)